jgi:thiamine-phosphate pyrophosphorylase
VSPNPLPSRLLLVTDRHQAAVALDEVVGEAVAADVRWVWLRDRDLPAAGRRALARRLLAIVRARGARLSVGGDVDLAAEVAADGVHLANVPAKWMPVGRQEHAPNKEVRAYSDSVGTEYALAANGSIAAARARLGAHALIGVSAHGDADVAAAAAAGADYATLSPIFATASKPGYGPELGVAALTRAARHGLPILALGGVTAERVDECLRAGAAGIAVMGEVMRARPGGVRDIVQRYAAALAATVG